MPRPKKFTKAEAIERLRTFDEAIHHPKFGFYDKKFLEWYDEHYRPAVQKITQIK